jgi:hypothetical protein
MFCPQCRVEYRPGFTHCTDCDVDLVHELPHEEHERSGRQTETPPQVETFEGEEFRPLVEYASSLTCASRCLTLQHAGIPYRVKELPRALGFQLEPRAEFQVSVLSSQFERAKDLLGIQIAHGEEADFPDEAEIQAAMELSVPDDVAVEEIRSDWDPSNWYPEDAIVEVWGGDAKKHGETIELSLRENRIHFRFDKRRDSLKIFVMPEDEARAREIVKEVVEGMPPN